MKNAKQSTYDGVSRNTTNQHALKLKAACEYLGGISPSSVRRLIKRRLLTPNRALRHYLFSKDDLDRFLTVGKQ